MTGCFWGCWQKNNNMNTNNTFLQLFATAFILGLFCSCEDVKDKDGEHRTHLAIQKEFRGPWSIIDRDGKIVVNDAYPSDAQISDVYDGVYWVMYPDYTDDTVNKFVLHSVESPDKPLCDTCLAATEFATGRAVVAMKGKPLQIINTKGKVIAVLPEEYYNVSAFNSDGVARYESSNLSVHGLIDRDGNKLVEPLLNKILPKSIGDGVMILDNGDIVDYHGEKQGTINLNKHAVQYDGELRFSDGLLCLVSRDRHEFVYINKQGEEQFSTEACPSFRDGYGVSSQAIFDKQGNELFKEDNQFDRVFYLANGLFVRHFDGKYNTIIDAHGKELYRLEESNNGYKPVMLGEDRFLLGRRIYDMQGKLISKIECYQFSESPCNDQLRYVNVEFLALMMVNNIDEKGVYVNTDSLIKRLDRMSRAYLGTHTKSLHIDSLLLGERYTEYYNYDGPIFYRQGRSLYLSGCNVANYTQAFQLPVSVDEKDVAESIMIQLRLYGFKDAENGTLVKEDTVKFIKKTVKVKVGKYLKVVCDMEEQFPSDEITEEDEEELRRDMEKFLENTSE